MIPRFQDYQLSVTSVPPGGVFNVPLQLDSDAPFALRLVKSRNIGASGWRFKGPKDAYQSSNFRTDLIDNGTGSLSVTQGVVIYPQMVFPANATISVDIANNTDAPLTNCRLLFRGSKLFPDGAYPYLGYPRRLSTLPFIYQVPQPGPGSSIAPVAPVLIPVSGNSAAVPGLSCSAVLNNILNIRHDSDFVLRYLAADPFQMAIDGGQNPPPQSYSELYVRLMDESRKPYSNEPIHIDDLFTQGQPPASNPNNAPNLFFPGLVYPEIYLPRQSALYFDLYRDDAALPNQFPVAVYFRFHGAKVFAR